LIPQSEIDNPKCEMRDYKNVKVPKAYRSGGVTRTSVKRVQVGGAPLRSRREGTGVTGVLTKAVVFLLVVAGGFGAWQGYRVIMHADMFVISGVDVKGVNQLREQDLKDIAAVFTGQNIFRVDINAATRKAAANPWVKESRIYRKLPNRITMVFTERVPFAVLDTGQARYLMDEEGVVIERLAKDRVSAWPLPVIAIRDYHARPGEQVAAAALAEARQLIVEIAGRGGWRLTDVIIKSNSRDSLSVVYADHEFKIGSGRYSEKLRRLAEVMADVKQRGLEIAYVDLRPERQAAVMVKKTSAKSGVQSTGPKKKRP
jgi:cell division septal protein FtsQ